mgnify:CR=1 FL=1|tara:strand:+ start:1045 stop:1428 length:384 start_codon:yes stop_codon:yes gene_type:complete
MTNLKIPSNRNFAFVFASVFLIIALWPILNNGEIRIWSILISIIFISLGILNSKLLTPFNKMWFKLGIYLGKFVSPLVMMIIFFLIVTPIGFVMKIIRKDILNLKFNKSLSYWIKRENKKTSMKQRF